MTHDETLLLIGHGTRDPQGIAEFRAFAHAVEIAGAARGRPRPILPCFLELADPSIIAAADRAVARGSRRFVAVPLMLQTAGHVKNDIPSALRRLRARHPAITVACGTALDVHAGVLAALGDRLAAAEMTLAPLQAGETAVLLVERGSSDPDANGNVLKVARLLWEGRRDGLVESCFWSITGPGLLEGLRRCVALGARRIVVLPYFLFQGILLGRIAALVEEQRAAFPGVELVLAAHLGVHPALVDLALQRVEDALSGERRATCDLCKYRVTMPGFAHDLGRPQGSDHAHGLRDALPLPGDVPANGNSSQHRPPDQRTGAGPAVSRAVMAAAPLCYLPDGHVDWGNMWAAFCTLAREGGPPHRGLPLRARADADPQAPGYRRAEAEILRGVQAVSGWTGTPAGPGWVGVHCPSSEMAGWLACAIVAENVEAHAEGSLLLLPVDERYTIQEEIKSVITVVAKTVHYWWEHRVPPGRDTGGMRDGRTAGSGATNEQTGTAECADW